MTGGVRDNEVCYVAELSLYHQGVLPDTEQIAGPVAQMSGASGRAYCASPVLVPVVGV